MPGMVMGEGTGPLWVHADHRSCPVTVRDIESQHAATVLGGALLFVVEDRREWAGWAGRGTTKHWCKGCICIHSYSGMHIHTSMHLLYFLPPPPPTTTHTPTHTHAQTYTHQNNMLSYAGLHKCTHACRNA